MPTTPDTVTDAELAAAKQLVPFQSYETKLAALIADAEKALALPPEDPASQKAANKARLKLKSDRCALEKARKELVGDKKKELAKIDAEAKRISDVFEGWEGKLQDREDYAANQEAERVATLKREREEAVRPYLRPGIEASSFNLQLLGEPEWRAWLGDLKQSHEDRIKREADAAALTARLSDDLTAAKVRHRAAETALATAQGRQQALAQTKALRASLEAAANAPVTDYSGEIAALEARLAELKPKVEDVVPEPKEGGVNALYSATMKVHDQLKDSEMAGRRADKALTELEALSCCPFCESTGDGFKEKLRSRFSKELREANEQTKQLDSLYRSKFREYQDANTALEAAQKRYGEWVACCESYRDDMTARHDLERKQAAESEAVAKARAQLAQLPPVTETDGTELATAQAAVSEAAAAVSAAEAALAAAREEAK